MNDLENSLQTFASEVIRSKIEREAEPAKEAIQKQWPKLTIAEQKRRAYWLEDFKDEVRSINYGGAWPDE